jgi:hypothetical protein
MKMLLLLPLYDADVVKSPQALALKNKQDHLSDSWLGEQ